MTKHRGFYTNVDDQPIHIHGDPNMSEETLEALKELVRCAVRAIENGTLKHGEGTSENESPQRTSTGIYTAWDLAGDWWWVGKYRARVLGGRTLYDDATACRGYRWVMFTRIDDSPGYPRGYKRYLKPDVKLELVPIGQ